MYSENYIVVTDRSEYADGANITADKAVARFTISYKVGHESDNQLHYSDLSGHYNLCVNCQEKINTANHTFDVKTVNDDTFAKAATCIQPAQYYYSCECGAHSNSQVFSYGDPGGHIFGEWQEIEVASCEEGGKEKRICSVCKAEEERNTDPLGHDWENDFTIDKEPTCTVPGSKSIHCTRCDAAKDETEIAPGGHTFGEWQESKAPTCTDGGKEKRICSVCKAEEERNTDPLGHDWENDFTIDKEPTCTVPGSKSIHCTRCDAAKDETEIAPGGHTFGEWINVIPASCLTSGNEKHICSVCDYEEFREIPMTGHIWESDFTVDIVPSCTQSGSKSIHCSRCDAVKDVTEIDATGHTFTEWSDNIDATCTGKGQKTRACTVCSYTEYADTDIDPDAHLWEDDFTIDKEPTCTEEGSKSVHCSRCDATKDSTVIPLADHIFGEWETITEATCTEDGSRKHNCINCGFEEKAVITADHVWDTKTTTDKEPTCTEEGSKSIHCTKCDGKKEVQPIPANGHDWSEWETVKASTSSENSLEKRYCFVCGFVEENELDLLPDQPENPDDKDKWHNDEEHHWHIDDDGNKTDVADHEFRWVVYKEPNGTEPGIGHYECISCDYAKFPREFGGKDSPETGSESLALWIAVAFVAGGVAPITLKIKSKKNK